MPGHRRSPASASTVPAPTGAERERARDDGLRDGGLAARDYFIAQAADGSLLWIYRARLPVADPLQPLWFLQGRFG